MSLLIVHAAHAEAERLRCQRRTDRRRFKATAPVHPARVLRKLLFALELVLGLIAIALIGCFILFMVLAFAMLAVLGIV